LIGKRLTIIVWREARAQLESRVRLIDGVVNLGYRMQAVYSLRIYVPTLPAAAAETDNGRAITVMRRHGDSIDKAVQTDIGKDMEDVCGGARTDAISLEERTVRRWIVFLMMCNRRRKRQREADRWDGVSLAVATEKTANRIGNDTPVAKDASFGDKGSGGSDNTNAGNEEGDAKVGDIKFDGRDLPKLSPVTIPYLLRVHCFEYCKIFIQFQ
jgi:hypothetical protein